MRASILKSLKYLLFPALLFTFLRCKKDNAEPLKADFSYEILKNGKVRFSSNQPDSKFFNWSFGNGEFSKLTNPEVQYINNGRFEVQLTVNNADVVKKGIEINNVDDTLRVNSYGGIINTLSRDNQLVRRVFNIAKSNSDTLNTVGLNLEFLSGGNLVFRLLPTSREFDMDGMNTIGTYYSNTESVRFILTKADNTTIAEIKGKHFKSILMAFETKGFYISEYNLKLKLIEELRKGVFADMVKSKNDIFYRGENHLRVNGNSYYF